MAIYDIYLKNFKSWADGTTIVNTWTHIQSIPISGEVFFNGPTVKNEMGKAGSCEFSLEVGSPCYNSLMQMKTLILIQYFGRTIFRGRVLTIDRALSGTRKIHCEGDLSFLLDSVQPPTEEDSRPTIDLITYLGQLLTQHNACVYEEDKMFELGEVPGHYTNASAGQQVQIPAEKAQQKFGGSDWGTTLDRLEELVGDFGGYLRTRVDDATGGRYLDWLDNYYDANVNPQSIEIAKNLIDISGTTEVDTLFTVVIPIGKSSGHDIYISDYWPVICPGHEKCQHITVPELATIPLFSDAELNTDYHRKEDYAQAINRFGNIWTTVSFANANTPEKLFNYCKDWMRRSFSPDLTQWSVTALDLGLVGNQNASPIYVGDRVVLSHKEETANINVFTVISIDHNLYNPEQTKYTIGIPNPQVNTSYGVPIKETKSSSSAGKGKKASGNKTPPKDGDDTKTPEEVATQNLTNLYLRKTEFDEDISLDDPLAFVVWKTDGTMYEGDEAKQRAQWAANLMARTKIHYREELIEEAARRGCAWDDEQLVIDSTPELKQAQRKWKDDFEWYAQNKLGMDAQQTQVLLNNSSSSSWLASLVDDNGNWTQAAIQAQIPDRQNAEEIRQMALRTRRQLDGTSKPDGQTSLNTVQNFISTLGLDLGDWGSMDALNMNFNLGDMFNLSGEDLTAKFGDLFNMDLSDMTAYFGDVLNIDLENFTFDLQSIQAWLDGRTGHSLFGKNEDEQGNVSWNVMLNHPVTYTGSDGQSHTTLMMSANDINLPQLTIDGVTYDSLRMRLLVVDELIANRATVGQLSAVEADIRQLTADMITADTLAAQIANINGYLNVNQLAITNSMRLDSGATFVVPASSGGISVAASKLTISSGSGEDTTTITPSAFLKEVQIVPVSGSNSQYKLQYKTAFASSWTDAGTFNKAVSLSGAWNGSTYTVSATSGAISGTVPSTTVYQSITGTLNPSETVYANVYKDNPNDQANIILTNELTLVENVASKKVSLMYSTLEKGAVSTLATYTAGQDDLKAAGGPVTKNTNGSFSLNKYVTTLNVAVHAVDYTAVGNPSYDSSLHLLQRQITVLDEENESISVSPLTVYIDPSSFLESRTGSNKITSNGTYTPGSGKIGFSSVVVDVQTAISSASWSWANGHAHVTLQPQNQSYDSPNITTYTVSGNPSYDTSTHLLQQNIIVTDENGDSVVPLSVTINPSSFLESRAGSNKITSNGTYTPSSGKIGFSSVVVDVQTGTTLSGSWSNGTLTVTASPQGITETFGIADNTSARTSWSSDKKTATVSVYAATGGSETLLDTGKDLTVDATDAYNAGQQSIKLLQSWDTDNRRLTITPSPNGSASAYIFSISAAAGITYDSGTHKYTASAQARVNNIARGNEATALSGTEAYTDGWDGCFATKVFNAPTASKTLDYDESVTVYASLVDSSGTTVSLGSRTYVAPSNNYTTGYAKGQQDLIDAGESEYTASANDNYVLNKYIGTLHVDVPSSPLYGVKKGNWSAGGLTVSRSTSSTASSVSIGLEQGDVTWSGNTVKVEVWDGDPADSSSSYTNFYTSVDVTSKIRAAHNAGGGTAWLVGGSASQSSQGDITPGTYISARYIDYDGTEQRIGWRWNVLKAWLNAGAQPAGSHDEGTLGYDVGIWIEYQSPTGAWTGKNAGGFWKTPPDRYQEGYDDGYDDGGGGSSTISVDKAEYVSSLSGLAYALGTSQSNLSKLKSGTIPSGQYFGFRVKCGSATPKYYYVQT